MSRPVRSVALALLGLLLTSSFAQAISPSLSNIQPRGGQRGTEVEFSFNGARLEDAQELLFFGPGFEVTKLEAANGSQVKATIKIAPDARLGVHHVRVRTASGISDFRTLYVGALPPGAEVEPNNDFAQPQKIDLNVTVEGIANNEDVDYYAVELKKGQRLSAEVEGMRLADTLFDPYVAILDSRRFELAANDDTPLVYQDAVASVVAPEDGTYIVEVRESSYAGNGNCRYRLHVGTFPRPLAVYPAGGKLGDEIDVRYLGDPAGELTAKIKLPAEPVKDYGMFAEDAGGIAPSPNPFRLFEHGNVLEVEPNNDVSTATPAELPLAFNGIIGEPGDEDNFRFTATKGQVFEVNCFARRIRSALDPVMTLHKADGGQIAANDDTGGLDAYFRFNVPADGEYVIRVRDHLGRGGESYVYRVEFSPIEQSLVLSLPSFARYRQDRQHIAVPQGNRYCTLINVRRQNFGGDLVLSAADLPSGMTMSCETLPGNLSAIPILFEATADAPVAGKLVDIGGKLAEGETNFTSKYEQTADMVVGAPGQSIYWQETVDKLAVAVAEPVPFKLEIVEPKVPLVQRGSMQLKIIAHRDEGFTKPIRVEFPFRPPGVNAGANVTIPEGQNEITYPLNAAGNAQAREWKVFVVGTADVGGPAWVSSQLAKLEVAEPYLDFAMERAACEQGQQANIFVTVTVNKEFEGAATAKLIGLPTKTATTDLELTKDTKELTFEVATEKESKAGQHKNLFCQVIVTANGEPIVHSVGNTELQIDEPLPAPVAKPEPMPMPQQVAEEKPKEPAPKRLSRLEKLRLQAEQLKAAATAAEGSE